MVKFKYVENGLPARGEKTGISGYFENGIRDRDGRFLLGLFPAGTTVAEVLCKKYPVSGE